MVRGGGEGAERENGQAGDFQRRGQKEKTHFNRRSGEALARGLLCRPAQALVGENSCHSRETGPEKERRPGVVL